MASKMYRSRSNKWFAGVCGGFANYFNIDPKYVRLVCAALILLYGSGLLVYIILAIYGHFTMLNMFFCGG